MCLGRSLKFIGFVINILASLWLLKSRRICLLRLRKVSQGRMELEKAIYKASEGKGATMEFVRHWNSLRPRALRQSRKYAF